MVNKLRRFWHLSRPQKQVFLQAYSGLILVWLAMWVLGFKSAYRFLLTDHPIAKSDHSLAVRDTAQMLSMAAVNLPLYTSCLVRSMVLWRLLRRQGIDSHLCIGVRKDEEQLAAHAWVEYEGVVLNDRQDIRQDYAPFDIPINQVMAMKFL